MQILRAANYRTMPWKNGMGSTTEIEVSPGTEGLDGFDWRISMARVEADGAFSSFPGIDRTLLVLEGDGIMLSVADRAPARLDRDSIHGFPGDRTAHASLIGGPIADLNVMTRREKFRHSVSRITFVGEQTLQAPRALRILVVERGVVTIREGAVVEALAERDAVLLMPAGGPVEIASSASAHLVTIDIEAVSQPASVG